MPQFIESASDIQKQLDEALEKLASFEEDVPDEQAWERLRAQSATHPVLLARVFFALLGLIFFAATLVAFAVPFVTPLLDMQTQRDLPLEEFYALERALSLPLPVALGGAALCLFVGWYMAGMAAISIGRDAPMLDWEAREHADIASHVKQLTRQRNALRKADPTPAPVMGPRVTAPAPDPNASFVSFDDGTSGGAPQWEEQPTSPHYALNPNAPGGESGLVDAGSGGFEKRISTIIPSWGPCEPWLQEALGKVEDLANTFPIQASIVFNQETGTPFTLRLQRATPAMTLRATMAFVEFLASIPSPPGARIDIAPIEVDRIFYRNVMSAIEPHFPDNCILEREDSSVFLKFTTPDARWARYPAIPLA